MAHGEQTAKSKMYQEALKMAEAIENGSANDPSVTNRALAYVIRMLEGAVTTDFVTADDVDKMLGAYRQSCPVYQSFVSAQNTKGKKMTFSIGPLTWSGAFSHVTIVAMVILFFVGKGKGWW